MLCSLIIKSVLGLCFLGIVAACGLPAATPRVQGVEPRAEATVGGSPAHPNGDAGQGSGAVQSHGDPVMVSQGFLS